MTTQLFFEDKVAPYHEIVDLLLSRNKSNTKSEALLMAERSKGRVLLDVLQSGRIDLAKATSPSEKEEDRKFNKDIVDLNLRISEENNKTNPDPTLLANLREQLRSTRTRYESFQDSLYASHPELRAQPKQGKALTLSDLSSLVSDRQTAFLEYAVTNSKVYLFVLTKVNDGDAIDFQVYPIQIGVNELTKPCEQFS